MRNSKTNLILGYMPKSFSLHINDHLPERFFLNAWFAWYFLRQTLKPWMIIGCIHESKKDKKCRGKLILESKSPKEPRLFFYVTLRCQIFWFWSSEKLKEKNVWGNTWCFVTKIFSTTMRKNCSSDGRKNFWNSRLKADNLQNIYDH